MRKTNLIIEYKKKKYRTYMFKDMDPKDVQKRIDQMVWSFDSDEWLHGFTIMCPYCFRVTVSPKNMEEDFKCFYCDRSVIPNQKDTCNIDEGLFPIRIDEFITDEIVKLNKEGYNTLACCSGHYRDPFPYVLFKKNNKTSLFIPIVIKLDKKLSYYLDVEEHMCDGVDSIRVGLKFNKIKAKYLKNKIYHMPLFKELLQRLIKLLLHEGCEVAS